MREILFRGQTRKKGEKVRLDGSPVESNWVYGGIFPNNEGGDFAIIYQQYPEIEKYTVYSDTVGQYTGLKDKNGTKIFEGDIVKYKQTDAAKRNNKTIICIGKVIYNTKTASFAVESKDKEGIKYFDYFPIKSCENIGNIHDNLELLEVVK